MTVQFIPVNEPLLDGREKEYLERCIDTGWISSEGPFVAEFEERFAATVGRGHGVAVVNGSAALEVAVAALGIGPGDEVILPTFTIISCAAAIVRAGAVPVLVDCEPDTYNMDVAQLEGRITSHTKAIMVVHIYGLPVDMEAVLAVAHKHGLLVIEDAAEMIGQTYRDRPCGSFGEISTFSFYPNKHITTGEGGMLVTDDEALAQRCRELRNLCFQQHRRFVHESLGWNYRLTNVQAALGIAQLERLDEHVARKRAMGRRYDQLLGGFESLQLPLPRTAFAENIYWVYAVVLKEEVSLDAAEVGRRLAKLGVGSRPFFWPMHEQPVFQKMGLYENDHHPVAERLARRGLYLPSGLALTEEQSERVAQAVVEVLQHPDGEE